MAGSRQPLCSTAEAGQASVPALAAAPQAGQAFDGLHHKVAATSTSSTTNRSSALSAEGQ